MIKLLSRENLKQFISYFFVGGIAAVVEWIMFWLFATVVSFDYMLATVLAFVFSTTANMVLGKIFTFRDNKTFKGKVFKEIIAIFGVSAIGLVFNMGLMYIFVSVLGMRSDLLMTCAKVVATGIVFIWNFLIRKFVIYKN